MMSTLNIPTTAKQPSINLAQAVLLVCYEIAKCHGLRPLRAAKTGVYPTDAQREELAATYRRGGFGYGEVKKALADLAENYFAEARARRKDLEAHPDRVRQVLAEGAATARKKAAEVLSRAQRACGATGW